MDKAHSHEWRIAQHVQSTPPLSGFESGDFFERSEPHTPAVSEINGWTPLFTWKQWGSLTAVNTIFSTFIQIPRLDPHCLSRASRRGIFRWRFTAGSSAVSRATCSGLPSWSAFAWTNAPMDCSGTGSVARRPARDARALPALRGGALLQETAAALWRGGVRALRCS
jgi:hypothetical protein